MEKTLDVIYIHDNIILSNLMNEMLLNKIFIDLTVNNKLFCMQTNTKNNCLIKKL
jgi:hypothetical protein